MLGNTERIKDSSKAESKTPLKIYQNPFFLICTLIPVIFVLLVIKFTIYLFVLLIPLLFIAVYIKKNQCKKCKRIFHKLYLNKTHLETKLQPHHYVIETKLLYSNGSYMESNYSEQKTIMERVEVHRSFNKGKYWYEEFYEDNEIH